MTHPEAGADTPPPPPPAPVPTQPSPPDETPTANAPAAAHAAEVVAASAPEAVAAHRPAAAAAAQEAEAEARKPTPAPGMTAAKPSEPAAVEASELAAAPEASEVAPVPEVTAARASELAAVKASEAAAASEAAEAAAAKASEVAAEEAVAPAHGATAAKAPEVAAAKASNVGAGDDGVLARGVPDEEPDGGETTAPPTGLWDRMKADPQYAPEHLALEAVRRLGPEAHEWGMRTRAQRPGIPPEMLADLAVKKFVNLARLSGAVSGATGIAGAVVDVGVLAWTQARMVLHLAAAYNVDPRDPERATDLLVLQKVHKVAETARLALGVAAGREKPGALMRGGKPVHQVLVTLGVKLAQMAGVRAAKRIFAKIVPGAAIILGTWANSSATTDLAKRTRALYAPRAYYWAAQQPALPPAPRPPSP